LHHHSHDLKTVVLSGTFVYQPADGTENKLGPGSYLKQAGGQKHISGCAPGAECEFFMTSSDKFDFIDDSASPDKKDDMGAKTDKK
jgi:quercetin dioxygenase-like cupin family protein